MQPVTGKYFTRDDEFIIFIVLVHFLVYMHIRILSGKFDGREHSIVESFLLFKVKAFTILRLFFMTHFVFVCVVQTSCSRIFYDVDASRWLTRKFFLGMSHEMHCLEFRHRFHNIVYGESD